ncbi:CLUMA_CG017147, isoform A [Clunio marinus]|uniref:CLUMA_CG017147, isoform A n=1 Tax=Clunio marinus TaxID=568069 RepID=A0A1J1IV28_9DIPT|nr:CLUMA_CG017147, isoform A [Clunio marinus]
MKLSLHKNQQSVINFNFSLSERSLLINFLCSHIADSSGVLHCVLVDANFLCSHIADSSDQCALVDAV